MLTYKPLIYLLTTFLLTLMASSCFQLSGSGSNDIMKNTANDSKTKKAVLFLKTGGATTDNSLQVSVIDFKENLSSEGNGNTFTTDTDHNKTTLDSNSINLLWVTNDSLIIQYDKKLRTFLKMTKVNDVGIGYELF